ncbi:TetR/AcrR family transcriptional regulator [Corynebacterium epidermidicanis]|uniref:Transcriptional regulator, TetR family n=1 Tax=Corynebacterium epidermidicanis TaxID=1050174 RepID=A0A0G3GX82_9CORY|nr:TetR/AcrR family transcriptional regulator [Corynebacterium epidermidicanis]AKK04113.1 hypothetical protein CEPID_11425 [Corynebacterium epidermidicanis]
MTPTTPLTPRQRQLFDALLTQFLKNGFATFTIDSAARELHCSKSTMYSLGATRDEIIRRILVSFFKEVTRRTDAQLTHNTSPKVALERYFTAMSAALEPASLAFLRDLSTVEVAREIYATNTQAATEKITNLIERGVAEGEFRTVNSSFLAHLISAAMQHIQTSAATPEVNAVDAYRELGQLVIYGLYSEVA